MFIALVSLLFFPLWLDDKRTNLKWELQREHHERYWKYREDVRIREQEAQREKWAAEHKQQESEIEESKQQRAAERKEREEQLRQWEAENREWEERRRRENEESKRKAEARKMRHHDFQIARKRAVRQINDLLERADRKALMGHCYMLTSAAEVRLSFDEIFLRGGMRLQRYPDFDSEADVGIHREAFVNRCLRNGLVPCLFILTPDGMQPVDATGWNLRHAVTEESLVPSSLVVPRLVEMSSWELNTQMALYVMEYLRDEHPKAKLHRDKGLDGDEILWYKKKNRWEWILLRRVPKLTTINSKYTDWIKLHYPSLRNKPGYVAQFTYSQQNSRGRMIKVEKPYRGVNYEIGFDGLIPVSRNF
ncbi:MAG: hypothetical protein AUK63_2129 [bacterium P3]|nr:MAG: hypothetical protein AUK63_2129 [bacterium P3]